jgi:Reverse transcriptase (RNA-dependent DNA polymerase)
MLNVKPSSLDWALQHVLKFGDTDVLPTPFEYDAIKDDWTKIQSYLSKVDLHTWTVHAHRSLLAPKGRYAFRVVTQLDPLDFILYSALVREIGTDLEAARVPRAKEIVFSYRVAFSSDGQLFDPTIGYDGFLRKADKETRKKSVTFVALADIADFYHRIYHHRLENSLSAATSRGNHVKAVMRLLSQWNGTETFGIPVGNAPSRVLAESLIVDVDEALLSIESNFIRYNDDYRIFCTSSSEAYRTIAFLAETLYRNHGLTLQPQKTFAISKEEFRERFLSSPEDREITSLHHKFESLVEALGLTDPYQDIDYDDLDDTQKELVDSLNLYDIFAEELEQKEIDLAVIKFVLRRLGQLGDDGLVDVVLDHLDSLYPAFPDIIQYLGSLRNIKKTRLHEIGQRVLKLLENSLISELEYHRIWALDLFARSTQWNNQDQFIKMLASARDQFSRRKLILALGRAHQRHWFQSQWRNLANESPWPRRALLAAASCMTPDARKHWYKSILPQLDELEKSVVSWAKTHPF